MWFMTSVCDELCKGFPLISRISSATSRSALSAGDPEICFIKLEIQIARGIFTIKTLKMFDNTNTAFYQATSSYHTI